MSDSDSELNENMVTNKYQNRLRELVMNLVGNNERKVYQTNKHSHQCLKENEIYGKSKLLIQLKDGNLVSCGNNILKVHNTTTLECITSIITHFYYICSLIQLQDGRLVFSDLREITIWNIITFQCIELFEAHSNRVNFLLQMKDGRLVSNCYEKMKVWDIISFQCIAIFETPLSFQNIKSKLF